MTVPAKTAAMPPAATVTIELETPFAGWVAECRSARSLPARIFGDFAALAESPPDAVVRLASLMERVVIAHNFPDALTGKPAASLLDCSPEAIGALAEAWTAKATTADPR